MNRVERSAIVPFSADQMYALVNDIEAYPEFLPWCSDARVLTRQGDTLTASVSMALGHLKHTFTTANTMQPGRHIGVRLLSGPFRHLEGSWELTPGGGQACEIRLEMHFEFKNRLLEISLGKVFGQIINSLVGAFTHRAEQIYGAKRS